MAKTDIENSFKIIPIHPDDQELLGFAIQGQYFYDKTLPIGLRMPSLMDAFSGNDK
jgi:hypothetical protein